MKVKAECSSCGGTGIYRGFAEPKGVGVMCLTCDGTGCKEIEYVPFTSLKKRSDIQTVQRSRGSFIFHGVGPTGTSVSYDEFLSGKKPLYKEAEEVVREKQSNLNPKCNDYDDEGRCNRCGQFDCYECDWGDDE